MRAVKIGLLIFTILITILLFLMSLIIFLEEKNFGKSVSTFFFLGCASAFSIYFHLKTLSYYPLFIFGKTIEEISKKYWALHIAFGLINLLLGIGLLFLIPLSNTIMIGTILKLLSISLCVFGLTTLWEVYQLNQFVSIYKRRKAQQKSIEEIQGTPHSK
ncbi:hypothetical protein [Kordia zhangzhouensis]|uniref:hypothetical protein n=1 Tax=Kordia zhangzhouensis TaxID=1620405 RepID=UPI0006291288|nr:hypothetical protein [Kordia zhangzhouensis]